MPFGPEPEWGQKIATLSGTTIYVLAPLQLEAAKTTNEAEMARLREQLSMLSPQRREAESKRMTELEKFIQRIDKEIAQKRDRFLVVRRTMCDPGGENCRMEAPPKSDAQIRNERELDALNVQRHEARRKLIELIAQ
jgi:hypothetical protein